MTGMSSFTANCKRQVPQTSTDASCRYSWTPLLLGQTSLRSKAADSGMERELKETKVRDLPADKIARLEAANK